MKLTPILIPRPINLRAVSATLKAVECDRKTVGGGGVTRWKVIEKEKECEIRIPTISSIFEYSEGGKIEYKRNRKKGAGKGKGKGKGTGTGEKKATRVYVHTARLRLQTVP